MKSLLFKVFLFGLLLGIFTAISTMLLGLIIYYGVIVIDIVLPVSFLTYAALASLGTGILCTLASYVYVLILVKQFLKQAVKL